jgi:hypothetical protein
VQVFELPEMLHPRSFPRGGFQFLLHRFGDQLSKRNAPFGSYRLRAAKQEIGDFKSGLHNPILPYLWESPGELSLGCSGLRYGQVESALEWENDSQRALDVYRFVDRAKRMEVP